MTISDFGSKKTGNMASASLSSITIQNMSAQKSTIIPSSSPTKPLPMNLSVIFMCRTIRSKGVRSLGVARYDEVVVDDEIDKIRRLQNGSDVRGVALEGEKGREVDLTPPAVDAIAESFGEWVIKGLESENGGPVEDVRVSLGRDPRISGSALSVAVFAGLSRAGCMVFDMGLATTPACFMSTVLDPFSYDASIMVV